MTPQPERHALAAVCNALTSNSDVNLLEFWQAALAPTKARGAVVRVEVTDRSIATALALDGGKGPRVACVGPVAWTVATPAEAFERLTTDGVLPLAWAGGTSRAFWCRGCAGHRELIERGEYAGGECPWCKGVAAHPSTFADLVAWSSLGVETIQRAEHLARETASRLRPWGVRPPVVRVTGDDGRVVEREVLRRVVWRVGALPERGATIPTDWPQGANDPRDENADDTDEWRDWWASHTSSGAKRTRATWWEAHVDLWPKDDPRPCPHEPVLELLRMGLALDALTDDALVVVVPPLGDVT